jgi:hypothetical protein
MQQHVVAGMTCHICGFTSMSYLKIGIWKDGVHLRSDVFCDFVCLSAFAADVKMIQKDRIRIKHE